MKVSELLVRWQMEIRQGQYDFVFIDMGSVINADLMEVIGIADYSLMFISPDFISFEKSNYFFRELVNYRLRNVELKYDILLETQNIRRACPYFRRSAGAFARYRLFRRRADLDGYSDRCAA